MKYIVIYILSFAVMAASISGCQRKPAYPHPPMEAGEVRIPLEALIENVPVFYSYQGKDRAIDFFVLLIHGEVQSYIDACSKCYPQGKGYRLTNGRLRCVYCGEDYPLEGLKGIGGCYPIALEGEAIGGRYVIRVQDVLAGEVYM